MTFIVTALLLLIEIIVSLTFNFNGEVSRNADIASAGDSMIIYSNYAMAYAQQNPTVTTTPTVTALNLPSWYVVPKTPAGTALISAYVQSGKAYTYYTGSIVGVGGYIAQKMQNGYIAGINNNGVLASPMLPAASTATETIPSQVPNGSTVLLP